MALHTKDAALGSYEWTLLVRLATTLTVRLLDILVKVLEICHRALVDAGVITDNMRRRFRELLPAFRLM